MATAAAPTTSVTRSITAPTRVMYPVSPVSTPLLMMSALRLGSQS